MQAATGNAARERVFEDHLAVRGPTPLLFGLIGPSGSGKTFSALRLATGMQRVFGGDIFMIDTESNRALHYAETFRFRHVPFAAPFSPLDYLAALDHCVGKGAKTIIVDSMSHEHEGPGGVLEWHELEMERLAQLWKTSADVTNFPAWAAPKAARRRLINSVLQMRANFIFCFRAKDKIKISKEKGKKSEVASLGFMPIAGEEFVYELTAKALLLPGANGVPTWKSDSVGEQMMIKLPEQFRTIFSGEKAEQLSEDVGEKLARWAMGDTLATQLTRQYAECKDADALELLEKQRADVWRSIPTQEKPGVKRASEEAAARLKAPAPATTSTSSPGPSTGGLPLGDDFDVAKRVADLRGAKTAQQLNKIWTNVQAHYGSSEIPLELEGERDVARERLGE